MTSGLAFEVAPPFARIVLDRAEKRNALTKAMWQGLLPLLARAAGDAAVKVVLLAGRGDHFAAGADIAEFPEVYRNAETSRAYGAAVAAAHAAFAALEKPVIAVIRGHCVGGGLSLALSADVRFASREATFAVTPAKLGLVYPYGDVRRLVEAVGPARAKDILFSARTIAGEEALRIGLVDHLVEGADLEAAALAYAEGMAELSQYSIRAMKVAVGEVSAGHVREPAAVAERTLQAFDGEDFKEGVAAFLQKRKPRFTFSG